jgi:hypothetical protein
MAVTETADLYNNGVDGVSELSIKRHGGQVLYYGIPQAALDISLHFPMIKRLMV